MEEHHEVVEETNVSADRFQLALGALTENVGRRRSAWGEDEVSVLETVVASNGDCEGIRENFCVMIAELAVRKMAPRR